MAIIPQSELEENNFFHRNFISIVFILLAIFLIAALSWVFYQNQKLQLLENDLSVKIKNLEGTPEFQKSTEYLDLKNKKSEIKKINQGKLPITAVLRLIENATLAQTIFSQFSINLEQRSIDLVGVASSYATLALQIENFEREKIIKSVVVKNPTRNENNTINFNLNFTVK